MQSKMNCEITKKLVEVGNAFQITAPLFNYEEIKNGNVNHTYKVNYVVDDGSGLAQIKSYLVQKINTVAFNNPEELMANIEKVTSYIITKYPNQVALHFHHTADNKNFLIDGDSVWRMSNYIKSTTYDIGCNTSVVRKVGEAFGNFQMQLRDFDSTSLYYTIPDFHDTRKRYAAFRDSVEKDEAGRRHECQKEIEWLLSVEDKACVLTDLLNEGKLPLRVTHNDTKINNVLFDEKGKEPLVVIDLDTVMPGLVGHDFGDAVRFAANFVEEDCPDTEKIGVDLNTFWAFAEGFISKTAKTLTECEADTLALSSFALACELATRFLADYLNGDKYFKVKKEKHNLIRARAQIALAKDMLEKMDAMNAICRASYEKYRK